MATSKRFDTLCVVVTVLCVVFSLVLMNGPVQVAEVMGKVMGYEELLFDTDTVHTIDIVMPDWESFLATCEDEEYSPCSVLIDGEAVKNIGIRGKGNTSLSSVRSMNSQRYSFKLEFDHYETGKTYHGLDKLCLNNLIQDNTMMKDYLVYQMMGEFGVHAPLCSFAYIKVNGEDWGLYLAVEGVEDSFLTRNYGSETGELYKPDTSGFGGGKGNGKNFDMDKMDGETAEGADNAQSEEPPEMPDGQNQPDGTFPQMPNGEMPTDGTPPQMPDDQMQSNGTRPQMGERGERPDRFGDGDRQPPAEGMDGMERPMGGGGGGRGSDDVKLKYIDDNITSYSAIFDNAKTDLTAADKKRLISSLKSLGDYSNLENVLDMEQVLRYFVVHNLVVNGDSYTGSIIHNYYLHEEDGRLSMIPWDYNLAFGSFMGQNASSAVNSSIDSPVTEGDVDDRPMVGWIFSDDAYTQQYHDLFQACVEKWFTNGELVEKVTKTADMLLPYVEKDPTKFCTTEDFEKGTEALKVFLQLRGDAVSRQLTGDSEPVDVGELNLSDMGTMNRQGDRGGNRPQ